MMHCNFFSWNSGTLLAQFYQLTMYFDPLIHWFWVWEHKKKNHPIGLIGAYIASHEEYITPMIELNG
jgi:hypothetical protein